jgi:3-isopropylmalate dehydrogenase
VVERALVEVDRAEHVVGDRVVGLCLHEALELQAGRPVISGAFGHERVEDTVVDEGIAQEQPTFGAELIGIGGLVAATLTSHGYDLLAGRQSVRSSDQGKDARWTGRPQRTAPRLAETEPGLHLTGSGHERGGRMASYTIGVIPGDGIGPEVLAEGLKVLEAVAAVEGFGYDLVEYPYSGGYYLETRELVPDRVIDEWRTLDAVLLGAIGHPDVEPGLVERSVILGLRFGLDLYINLRPIKLYAEHLCPLKDKGPADIDFVVVRENTEGFYSQIGGHLKKNTPDEVALVNGVYTWKGCERASRYAFELARKRVAARGDGADGRVTLVDKANALRPHDIWTRAYAQVARDFPEIATDHAYVDACCMWMIKNPEWFDVIVTTNMFGDIITDLGSMLQGGMGIAASGNIHPGKTSMFEPIHGSAPKYTGMNVACPLGAIGAVGMMLDYLGEAPAAARVEEAMADLLRSGTVRSADARSGIGTSAIGDMVVERLAAVS